VLPLSPPRQTDSRRPCLPRRHCRRRRRRAERQGQAAPPSRPSRQLIKTDCRFDLAARGDQSATIFPKATNCLVLRLHYCVWHACLPRLPVDITSYQDGPRQPAGSHKVGCAELKRSGVPHKNCVDTTMTSSPNEQDSPKKVSNAVSGGSRGGFGGGAGGTRRVRKIGTRLSQRPHQQIDHRTSFYLYEDRAASKNPSSLHMSKTPDPPGRPLPSSSILSPHVQPSTIYAWLTDRLKLKDDD
jgi:hypothetical protein